MRQLGLHISTSSTKAILVDHQKDKGIILDAAEFEIPDGMLTNGDITNLPLFTKHLKEIRKKFGKANAIISVPSRTYTCTVIRLPDMTEEEIRQSLEFEMEKYIKKGVLSDYIWGYIPINEVTVETDRQRTKNVSVLVVAFLKDYITNILTCAKKAGLHVVSVESEDLALWRAYYASSHLNYMSIHISSTETQVSTCNKGNLFYMRPRTGMGTTQLFNLGDGGTDAYDALIEELRRTSEYYIDRAKTTATEVFLTATEKVPEYFINRLYNDIGIPVKPWTIDGDMIVGNIPISSKMELDQIDETFAAAMGLALQPLFDEDKIIDLIPKDYVRKDRVSQIIKISLGTAGAVVILLGSFVLYVHILGNRLDGLQQERNSVQREIDRGVQLQTEINNLQQEIADMKNNGHGQVVIGESVSMEIGNFMQYIEKNIPRDMKIHNMTYDSVQNTIKIKAIADSQQSIGAFLLLLEQLEEIGEAKTGQIKQYKFGNITYLASEIEVRLAKGGSVR